MITGPPFHAHPPLHLRRVFKHARQRDRPFAQHTIAGNPQRTAVLEECEYPGKREPHDSVLD
jgi:hypothetical protein